MDNDTKIALNKFAERTIIEAVEAYAKLIVMDPVHDADDIIYTPTPVGLDSRRFEVDGLRMRERLADDLPFLMADHAARSSVHVTLLSLSPHWQDRIRAVALQETIREEITLPDGFPCIYEPADSPKNRGVLQPIPEVWVASPDIDMLRELLPLYQELWAAYENQWPHTPNRTFEIGRLDGVSPRGVYRPGTTPAEVIGRTMLTHTDMYRTAPEHLREMHPQHAVWTKSRLKPAA